MPYIGNDRDILVSCIGGRGAIILGNIKKNVTLQAATRLSYRFDVE
jgi:hypothetical protein